MRLWQQTLQKVGSFSVIFALSNVVQRIAIRCLPCYFSFLEKQQNKNTQELVTCKLQLSQKKRNPQTATFSKNSAHKRGWNGYPSSFHLRSQASAFLETEGVVLYLLHVTVSNLLHTAKASQLSTCNSLFGHISTCYALNKCYTKMAPKKHQERRTGKSLMEELEEISNYQEVTDKTGKEEPTESPKVSSLSNHSFSV